MGVHFQIYCGCGAFPGVELSDAPVVSAPTVRPCTDSASRDLRSGTLLHGRLANTSLRAFDPASGSFTFTIHPDHEPDGNPTDPATDEPVTVAFIPSEHLANRPGAIRDFETFIRTARPGTPLTLAGRWVTRSWQARSGDMVSQREFEATRFAEGRHARATLCGANAGGPLACPALAARQLLEAHLPSNRNTPGTGSGAAGARAFARSTFAFGRRITLRPPPPPPTVFTDCSASAAATGHACRTPGCCAADS